MTKWENEHNAHSISFGLSQVNVVNKTALLVNEYSTDKP